MDLYLSLVFMVAFLSSAYPYLQNQNELIQAKERMKRDMLGNVDTQINTVDVGGTTSMYGLDEHAHKQVMREVIEEELSKENLNIVLNFVRRQHEDCLYAGYMKIFVLIEQKSLGDAAMFQLAYQIKEDIYKGEVLSLLNLFPVAVRSLLTAPTVCIKNRGYGEYFYAAESKLDHLRRHVFMWRPNNEAGKQGDWKFRHINGNKFQIINLRFNEYLYADGGTYNNDGERRRIFTNITPFGISNVWAIEMEGEDVFIKNVHYGEYIYALDGGYYDQNRRAVFSWTPKGREACDGNSYQCRWMLSVC